ncbi:hypothetical protein [Burkholderia multivorans]|uniref:hypothetical protein n=1 Tax=Burkholderia multivorans TaxID=87883 RepID=UPI0011B1F574|nr:hypothetical protein [Burkholderia multivorans]
MEAATLIPIAAAAGALGGAAISAIGALIVSRQASRQRRREQLIERAYEAGMAEFHVHIEAHRANVERGHQNLPLPPAYFVSFHLALLNELTDLGKSRELDPETIARALENATVMEDRFHESERRTGGNSTAGR